MPQNRFGRLDTRRLPSPCFVVDEVATVQTILTPEPSGSSFRPFTGDYNGIASTNASAELTWTGVSPPSPFNLDIFAATVTP
jgi:hypothetical protein